LAQRYIDILKERFGDAVVSTHAHRGDETAVVAREAWTGACRFLKDEHGFDMMVDLCGADYPTRKERFEVVIHLRRMQDGARLRLKSRLDSSDPRLDSITGLYPAANWFEREAFDLFGIAFVGHNDLRRILTDYGFIGHPFRKDFPISGHVEMRYDPDQGRVIYQPVTIEPRENTPRIVREDTYGDPAHG